MSVQRWSPYEVVYMKHGTRETFPANAIADDEGEYVTYADHARIVAAERAKNMPWTCAKDGTLNPYGFACIECIRLAAYERGKADAEQAHAAALAEIELRVWEEALAEGSRARIYARGYEQAVKDAAAPRTLSADDRSRIAKVLLDNGFDSGTDMHASWRCGDTDRYPDPCRCLDTVLDEIAAALIHNGEAK